MDGVEGASEFGRIPRADARGLGREAAKALRTLRFSPRKLARVPAFAPTRRVLSHPAGIGAAVAQAGADLRGITALAQYVNGDTYDPPRACGPAALATLITFWGTGTAAEREGLSCVNTLMSRDEPSLLGLSPGQLEAAAAREGLAHGGWISGEAALALALERNMPAAILLDLSPLGRGPEMHWVVAHACDSERVYLTNWGDGSLTWAELKAANSTWRTLPLRTAGRYFVPLPA